MFPLTFPLSILRKYAVRGQWVMDPFCGRGTTNYAARVLGLGSVGIDSNPVAVALTQAKLSNTTPSAIERAALRILDEIPEAEEIPDGEFWQSAFHEEVLAVLCRLRQGLLKQCRSDSRSALRAIIMGALHGPQGKQKQTYFSNQCPRTYAPKPAYAMKFWEKHSLSPKCVDVVEIIRTRARRYYSEENTTAVGRVIKADSRNEAAFSAVAGEQKVSWIITSPPYFGVRTYIPDQWLRSWFIGGQSTVDYSSIGQLEHSSAERFTSQLSQVWKNLGKVCASCARLVIRFGAINSRKTDSVKLIKQSLQDSGWKLATVKAAGSASLGKRQASLFSTGSVAALEEHDLWAIWQG